MAVVAAHRRFTTSTPIQGGHEVVTYAVRKPLARSMRSPFPPAWPWHVNPELGLLMAFVDIVGSHEHDEAAMVALFESALRRVEAREQGRLSAADRRRAGEPIYAMTDELRALFGAPDPVRALIGGTEDDRWRPGLAGLTQSEQEACWLHLHGLSRASIALAMAPTRAKRFGRAGALPLETVTKYLWRARRKLRGAFALPLEREASYLAALDAEEALAAAQERAVDPAITAALEVERGRRHLAWPAAWEELPEPATEDEEPWLDDVDHDPRGES